MRMQLSRILLVAGVAAGCGGDDPSDDTAGGAEDVRLVLEGGVVEYFEFGAVDATVCVYGSDTCVETLGGPVDIEVPRGEPVVLEVLADGFQPWLVAVGTLDSDVVLDGRIEMLIDSHMVALHDLIGSPWDPARGVVFGHIGDAGVTPVLTPDPSSRTYYFSESGEWVGTLSASDQDNAPFMMTPVSAGSATLTFTHPTGSCSYLEVAHQGSPPETLEIPIEAGAVSSFLGFVFCE